MFIFRSLFRKKFIKFTLLLIATIFVFSQALKGAQVKWNSDSFTTSWTRIEHNSLWLKLLSVFEKTGEDAMGTVEELKWFERDVLFNSDLSLDSLNAIEAKVFPFLNVGAVRLREVPFGPVWKRWNKQLYVNSLPRFSAVDNTLLDVQDVTYDSGKSFWWNWLEHMTQPGSRGIVISVGDQQAHHAVRLIRVLRYLKNDLPIQVTHKGDLSEFQQNLLIEAARKDGSDVFPSQELWFVDLTDVLSPAYVKRFKRFSNKWLALLFCSFEQPIILDADTVPFSPLHHYYDFPQFSTYGNLFFKDRRLLSTLLSRGQVRTLKKVIKKLLTPNARSKNLSDQELYSSMRDPIALKALKDMLEKRHRHHVDSGLVLLDKKRHLFDILTSLALQFSSIGEYFHGDKDWFWMSPLLRGVPYTFHPVEASIIGKLDTFPSDNEKSLSGICSIQLAHTDEHDSLLWLNGGMSTCKLNSWVSDYLKRKSISTKFDTASALRKYYHSAVPLEAVIIPDVENYPWVNTDLCARYEYCAYHTKGDNGKLIKFTDAQKHFYQEISKIWLSG